MRLRQFVFFFSVRTWKTWDWREIGLKLVWKWILGRDDERKSRLSLEGICWDRKQFELVGLRIVVKQVLYNVFQAVGVLKITFLMLIESFFNFLFVN